MKIRHPMTLCHPVITNSQRELPEMVQGGVESLDALFL